MKILNSPLSIIRTLVCAAAILMAVSAHAQIAYRFTVNTTPLIGDSAAPFYLDFQLTDGSGSGDGNNTAWLSNFNFHGGVPMGATAGAGTFTGNLSSSVSLSDRSFFNEFYQAFTPGSFLQFDLNLTTRVDSGLFPDSFAFAILDSTLFNLPTLSGGSDVFASIDITGPSAVVHTFASNGSVAPAAGGPMIVLPAPTATAIPEPSTYGCFAAVALAFTAVLRLRRRSRSSFQRDDGVTA
jgi:hypothetical protein